MFPRICNYNFLKISRFFHFNYLAHSTSMTSHLIFISLTYLLYCFQQISGTFFYSPLPFDQSICNELLVPPIHHIITYTTIMSTSKRKCIVGNHDDSTTSENGSLFGSGDVHIQRRNGIKKSVVGQFHPTCDVNLLPMSPPDVSQDTVSALKPNILKIENFTNSV